MDPKRPKNGPKIKYKFLWRKHFFQNFLGQNLQKLAKLSVNLAYHSVPLKTQNNLDPNSTQCCQESANISKRKVFINSKNVIS